MAPTTVQSPGDGFFADPAAYNSAARVAQSVGNMTLTEVDISKDLAGAQEDPFNLTASSRQMLPVQ